MNRSQAIANIKAKAAAEYEGTPNADHFTLCAVRAECQKLTSDYMRKARQAIWSGNRELAHSSVEASMAVRAAFFAEYAEAI